MANSANPTLERRITRLGGKIKPEEPSEFAIQLKVETSGRRVIILFDYSKLEEIARILAIEEVLVSIAICEAALSGDWVTVGRYWSRDIAEQKHFLLRMQLPFLIHVSRHDFRLQKI